MTGHDLKVWLVVNGYTQQSLASELGVTVKTVNKACNGKPRRMMALAIKQLENKGVK